MPGALTLPAAQRDQVQRLSERLQGQLGRSPGAGRPSGVRVLFVGPSPALKCLAAQLIADGLGGRLWGLRRRAWVGRCIGETKKNIDRLFRLAAGTGAVLLFDEADALSGRRSELCTARSRCANLEVSYLLMRAADYRGVVILSVASQRHVDAAARRRLRGMIEFSAPASDERG